MATYNIADTVWVTYLISVTSASVAEVCKYFSNFLNYSTS